MGAATLTYDGTPTSALIASETNPWVERDGVAYSWMTADALALPAAPNGCDQCAGSPVAGAIPAMDTEHGIQRCDQCDRFPGDLDAALALAAVIGGTVRFETEPTGPCGHTLCAPHGDQCLRDGRTRARTP